MKQHYAVLAVLLLPAIARKRIKYGSECKDVVTNGLFKKMFAMAVITAPWKKLRCNNQLVRNARNAALNLWPNVIHNKTIDDYLILIDISPGNITDARLFMKLSMEWYDTITMLRPKRRNLQYGCAEAIRDNGTESNKRQYKDELLVTACYFHVRGKSQI